MNSQLNAFLSQVMEQLPTDWLVLTTHRLDIYDESQAKTAFLEGFEALYAKGSCTAEELAALPTAYDYIRLGHPLSTVLEWAIAKIHGLSAQQVIAFDSKTIPVMAVLRKNGLTQMASRLVYTQSMPIHLDEEAMAQVYGYTYVEQQVESLTDIIGFDGETIALHETHDLSQLFNATGIQFQVNVHPHWGAVLIAQENKDEDIAAIQHVRRRETIAMTPANCHLALQALLGLPVELPLASQRERHLAELRKTIQHITGSASQAVVASSGLSMQYAIMMGLIEAAGKQFPRKGIRIIVPPNCYGGTNDQARRVAACLPQVEVVDLPVDGDNDMVQSVDQVLEEVAAMDAIPLIIAEIPTNPRVEVPDLEALKDALARPRKTKGGGTAMAPVFILDQTFCPNVPFVAADSVLSRVATISYVSGSKFPSGGKCTAGYCVANAPAEALMPFIDKHLKVCDNEATDMQVEILNQNMPSMVQRIQDAYQNTRRFVRFIEEKLPEAKINFVSETLAAQGFTPSVFSLDLPTKGSSPEEREEHKRKLNDLLIGKMITEIPHESKYCVSYGQLKGCYWTIPATSTQGTTKESDKDYIARVAVSPDLDLDKHLEVFADFVEEAYS